MKTLTLLKIVTVVNLLVATGFSVAGIINPALILPPGIDTDKRFLILALYAGARTIPLAIITIFTVFNKNWNTLFTLAILAGTIQLLDGFIGLLQNDLSKILGPFVIAVIQFAVVYAARNSKQNIV